MNSLQVTKFLAACFQPPAPELVTVDILTIFSHMARRLPESNDKILSLLMPSQQGSIFTLRWFSFRPPYFCLTTIYAFAGVLGDLNISATL